MKISKSIFNCLLELQLRIMLHSNIVNFYIMNFICIVLPRVYTCMSSYSFVEIRAHNSCDVFTWQLLEELNRGGLRQDAENGMFILAILFILVMLRFL